jgi:hypothetical protein
MPSPAEQRAGDALIALIKTEISKDAKDVFKEEDHYSKVLAHLVAPFNPNMMDYNTTVNRTTIQWGQGRKRDVLSREWYTFKTRAHEGQHMWDWPWLKWVYGLPHLLLLGFLVPFMILGKLWALYSFAMLLGGLGLGYVMPAKKWWFFSWAGLGIAACATFAIWKTHWASIWLGAGALCASPALNWLGAAVGRAAGEIRGYTISMAVNYWRYGSVLEETEDWIVQQFTSSAYYFMLPWGWLTRWVLRRRKKLLESGAIFKQPWANKVYSIMREQGIAQNRVYPK